MKPIELYRYMMQGVWNIGFVENSLDGIFSGEDIKVAWLKHDCKDRWFADPFILDVTDDKILVLVEEFYYPTMLGRLAMLTIDRATMTLLKSDTILELNTHLSFPAILRQNGKVFVYPENFKGGGLNLYELDIDNAELKPVRKISDALLTDAIYTELFGKKQIFSTEFPDPNGSTLHLYEAEADGKYIRKQSFAFEEKIARNAGDWFVHNGEIYRPAQECNVEYGHGISLQKVVCEDGQMRFEEVRRMTSPHPFMKVAFHTLNMYKDMIVVDCRGYRFRMLAGIINAFRSPFIKK